MNNVKFLPTYYFLCALTFLSKPEEPNNSLDECAESPRYVLPQVTNTSSSRFVCRDVLRYEYYLCSSYRPLPAHIVLYSSPAACRRSASWLSVSLPASPVSCLFCIYVSRVLPVTFNSLVQQYHNFQVAHLDRYAADICYHLKIWFRSGQLGIRTFKKQFEPFIRASSVPSSAPHRLRTAQHTHSIPIAAAASVVPSWDVPGISKYNPLS